MSNVMRPLIQAPMPPHTAEALASPAQFVQEEDSMTLDGAEELDEDEDEDADPSTGVLSSTPPPPPPGLKEISSLACWTVSSSKPGCAVAALRSPTTNLFWQSDGPQPHLLNIHFFKMVSISAMRIYLDFEMDESYTPTLIHFAAGTGYHDLQEFSVMRFNQPQGWIDVDWEGVGGEGEDEDDEEEEDSEGLELPVLRCMLIQIFAKDPAAAVEKQGSAGEVTLGRSEASQTPQLRKIETVSRPKKHWADMGDWMDTPILR